LYVQLMSHSAAFSGWPQGEGLIDTVLVSSEVERSGSGGSVGAVLIELMYVVAILKLKF
jgi:hypothetical protein